MVMDGDGLSLRNITFAYPLYGADSAPPLLDGLDYYLDRGGTGVILGGADEGKTTLTRIIAGLVPRFTGGSLTGSIGFRGTDLGAYKPYELTETIGTVFQDPEEQLLTTRCDTEVSFALESLGIPRGAMEDRVERALALMGLIEFRARNPATLSGGEKKRLLLACVAAVDPELWILDEAFEELDDAWKSRLLGNLRERGKTILFFDSRMSSLYASHGSRFSLLKGGKIVHSAHGAGEPDFAAALERERIVLRSSRWDRDLPKTEGEACLFAEGLFFRFPDSESFSLSVDKLQVRKGEICSLLGRNGSGKSTLGKLLCGLLTPRAGAVSLKTGNGDRRAQTKELGRRVGYMFQNPDYQIFLSTVFEELAFGLRSSGLGGVETERRVEEAIRIFNLPSRDSPPALMSYGARKRLQAAVYYLLERDVLILDEIDSGLTYGEFIPLLAALASGGAGIVIVTQDVELARAVSRRILLMREGRIAGDYDRESFPQLDRWDEGEE